MPATSTAGFERGLGLPRHWQVTPRRRCCLIPTLEAAIQSRAGRVGGMSESVEASSSPRPRPGRHDFLCPSLFASGLTA
eukprot:1138705-Rhodomonas_salina.3